MHNNRGSLEFPENIEIQFMCGANVMQMIKKKENFPNGKLSVGDG